MEENNMTPAQELDNVINSLSQTVEGNEPAPASEPPAAAEGGTTQTEPVQNTEPQQTQSNPANAAFAQMRTENAKLNNIIKQYAQLNNLDASNLDAIAQQLEEKVTSQEAAKAQVPPEFMARFKQQEAMLNAIMQQNAQNNLSAAMDNVGQAFNLDQSKLYSFAQELKEGNYNLQDLSKLGVYYKGLHFEELVEAKVAEALANANADKQYAAAHGATVSAQAGTLPGAEDDKGDAVADTLAAINAGLTQS